jgi:hypothetical protein
MSDTIRTCGPPAPHGPSVHHLSGTYAACARDFITFHVLAVISPKRKEKHQVRELGLHKFLHPIRMRLPALNIRRRPARHNYVRKHSIQCSRSASERSLGRCGHTNPPAHAYAIHLCCTLIWWMASPAAARANAISRSMSPLLIVPGFRYPTLLAMQLFLDPRAG